VFYCDFGVAIVEIIGYTHYIEKTDIYNIRANNCPALR